MWATIKELAGAKTIQTPRTIIDGGATVTSPKQIANVLNERFVDKIETIRAGFTPPKIDPIELLRELAPRPDEELEIKEITLEETKKYIKNLKATNTTGYDRISSKILKLAIPIMSILITHAINSSLRENKFPESLKITRILPILNKK